MLLQLVSVSRADTNMAADFTLWDFDVHYCSNLIQDSVQPYDTDGLFSALLESFWECFLHACCCSYIPALINNLLHLWVLEWIMRISEMFRVNWKCKSRLGLKYKLLMYSKLLSEVHENKNKRKRWSLLFFGGKKSHHDKGIFCKTLLF